MAEAVAVDPPTPSVTPSVTPGGTLPALSAVASLHAGGSHGWRLPATPMSIPAVRRRLRAALDDTGLAEDERYDLLLVVCEAATNAIEHAQEPTEPYVDVLLEVTDGRLTIVVRDHGRWRPGPPTPHRGRGLSLMRDLADTTVDSFPHGTTVTIRCRADAPQRPADRPRAG